MVATNQRITIVPLRERKIILDPVIIPAIININATTPKILAKEIQFDWISGRAELSAHIPIPKISNTAVAQR